MKKATLLAAAAALSMVTSTANATFVLGGDIGVSKIDPDFASEESSFGAGVFAQIRTSADKDVIWGIHLGRSVENAEFEGAFFDASTSSPALIEAEIEHVVDVLGLVMFPKDNGATFFMLGHSRAKVDATASLTNGGDMDLSDTFTGTKAVFGHEVGTNDPAFLQAFTYFATYEEGDFEADQFGFKISLGLQF